MNKLTQSYGDSSVPENYLVTPTVAFFLIHSMQIGVGVLGFERYIAKDAGYDAWISIIIGGVFIHILLWMIYQILKGSDGDIVSVHQEVFGKYLGNLLSMVLSLYFLLLALLVLRTFIEVIQVWIYPNLNVWVFSFVFLLLAYYIINGGFRVIAGICVMSVILGVPLLMLKFFPIQYAHVENLFPVFNHTLPEILASTETMTLSFLGIELLLIYYPFIKDVQTSKKWAHLGVLMTTLIYLGATLVAFTYFSEMQLKHVIWGTVTLWKIVEFPFIERFEYVGVAMWVYIILPNICLALWGATRIPKRIFHIKQRVLLGIYFLIVFLLNGLLKARHNVDMLNTISGQAGLYILAYIPILFLMQKIVRKVRNRK